MASSSLLAQTNDLAVCCDAIYKRLHQVRVFVC